MFLVLAITTQVSYAQIETDSTVVANDAMSASRDTTIVLLDSVIAEQIIDSLIQMAPESHSPERAALLSAVIPGMGQVYNKKYWKVPIIYVAYGVLGYYVYQNNFYYNQYRSAYFDFKEFGAIQDDNKYDLNGYLASDLSEDQLLRGIDTYQRWRDLTVITAIGLYFLNIVDATVDAHFFDYDISSNLSLNLKPVVRPTIYASNYYGITCTLKLKQ